MSVNEQLSESQVELDALEDLLEKQIKLARLGNITELEVLSKQASCYVEKIAETRILESVEYKNQKDKLEKLYRDLCLTLAVQKAETAEELKQVRRGKKTIGAYRSNL